MKIETHLPIPGRRFKKYPFADMSVGEHFSVPWKVQRKTLVAASLFKSRHKGWNYTSRTERGVTTFWRTE